MDLPGLALMVGETKANTDIIIENQKRDHNLINEHSKRLDSLESKRWGIRLLYTSIVAAFTAAVK